MRLAGRPFGDIVDMPATASAMDRFVTCLGRDPVLEARP